MTSAPLLIKNARIVDPSRDLDAPGHLLVADGKIQACDSGELKSEIPAQCENIDASGKAVLPGLVDMHVNVGEPGGEYRETLHSAGQAAAAGGVTTYLMLPNTEPAIDEPALVDFLKRRASASSAVNVVPSGALTSSAKGEDMAELGLLADAGARAFYHGPFSIQNHVLMKRALTYARDFSVPVICDLLDPGLGSGAMNAGLNATRLGLSGVPAEAELIPLDRDMRLVAMTGATYHAAKISTSASLDVIRAAKSRGLPVTAGVSINNLTLNDTDIGAYRTFLKLLPPVRSEDDRLAMVDALRDGTIDVIVSDHDPHDVDTKRHPFAEAEPGAVGLETLLPAALRLYHNGSVDLLKLVAALTINPAKLLGLEAGTLHPGKPADCVLVDLEAPFVVKPEDLKSLTKNTPYEDARFEGRVLRTLVGGKTVFKA